MKQVVHIRSAEFADMAEVGRIHVQSWQETYVGLVPQTYLDGLNVEDRQKKWEEIFRDEAAEDSNLLVAEIAGKAVGFISFGRARDDSMQGSAEIYAVYLLKDTWGEGAGYALFFAAQEVFRQRGFSQIYLWALDTNLRALSGYKRWGG